MDDLIASSADTLANSVVGWLAGWLAGLEMMLCKQLLFLVEFLLALPFNQALLRHRPLPSRMPQHLFRYGRTHLRLCLFAASHPLPRSTYMTLHIANRAHYKAILSSSEVSDIVR
jgi:hypothetical protein